eukprot:CAMPEP_0184482748 /NCGR_PEP_ID=MMETSP0113_2-20130426/4333_1 /TAXON_ID=91329 /ORGANISM="Norrisiella sphaerica, Strain BC52" /LENGTH=41 /DNA_ID= /DNA_START= /DNA_END= /DNA_ORIENTATION=
MRHEQKGRAPQSQSEERQTAIDVPANITVRKEASMARLTPH